MIKSLQKIADMHCHIVPGVDDGAKTMDESMAIIKSEYEQGVRLIIVTPHWRRGMFETDRKTVYDHFIRMRDAAQQKFSDLQMFPGCEFHVNADMIEEMGSDGMLRMNASDFVLTEFSSHHDQNFVREIINQEISSGYTPIIAHIERYPACINDFDFIAELRRMGARVQVNADSVAGRDGRRVRHSVLRLIEKDCVDFIGSDAHNTRDRACHLLDCEKVLLKKFGSGTVEKIMWNNPNEIVERQQIGEKVQREDGLTEGESRVKHKKVTIHLDI